MRDDVRCYGDISGISPQAFETLRFSSPFTDTRYENGRMHLDHEGKYIDVEPFLDEIVQLLDKDGWGGVDFLDHLGQELIRYDLRPGEWTSQKRPFSAIGTTEMRGL